ncbi:MAG: histidinol-phosphatase [Cyclobacteriaceae bacterium]|nr:histidinol-phosphatase [Cyclobacteriaceae bacterium]
MTWTNYHNHCKYCDGVLEIKDHVENAMQNGIKSLGFSSHMPVPFENHWSMKYENLQKYLQEIDDATKKYSDEIEIYKSLEVDYIPGMLGPSQDMVKEAALDYTIGSVHFVGEYEDGTSWEIDGPHHTFQKGLAEIYNNDIRYVIEKYFAITIQMLEEEAPTILGHVDKIKMHNTSQFYFDEQEAWYRKSIMEVFEAAAAAGVIVEVNTRGLYKKKSNETYPGLSGIKTLKDMNIPICLNSDAHHPKEITGYYRETAELMESVGIKELMVLKKNEWIPLPFSKEGIFWD